MQWTAGEVRGRLFEGSRPLAQYAGDCGTLIYISFSTSSGRQNRKAV